MRKLLYTLFILVGLFFSSLSHAQTVLQALEGEIPFTPSEKCLERVYDRNYGDGDHNFIYCAVQGPNGKKWLNLNLGAEYAREDSPYFNPEAQPVTNQDWKAFGNLFQYGRKADGHEIVTYLTDTDPDPTGYWKVNYKYSPTTVQQDAFNSNNQTVMNIKWYNNDHSALDNAWSGTMVNNPCPSNYRVMNSSDIDLLIPYQDRDVDLTRIDGHSNPGIIRNKKYPELLLMIGPTHAYHREFVGNPLVTWTKKISAGLVGTASLHMADTQVENTVYSQRGDELEWFPGVCSTYIKGYPGTKIDIYCGDYDELARITETSISAVRCVEK